MSTDKCMQGIELAREELRKHGKILCYTGQGWIIKNDPHLKNEPTLAVEIVKVESKVDEIDLYYELYRN